MGSKSNFVGYENKEYNTIPQSIINTSINHQVISITDEKIRNPINERLIKIVKIGLRHELTPKNVTQYFKEVGKSKLYELRRYFSDSNASEIEQMIKFFLHNKIRIRMDGMLFFNIFLIILK